MFVAGVAAHMIKLTEEYEIAPYVWCTRTRRGEGTGIVVRKDGHSGPDALDEVARAHVENTSNVNVRTRLEGGFSSAIKFCFRRHFGFGLIVQHCCQHPGAPSP